ncbi:MAG: hypothetical protein WD995_05335 [Gemmatimonadota bacterium]
MGQGALKTHSQTAVPAARTGSVIMLALLGAMIAAPVAAWQQIPIAERRAGLTDTRWGAFVGCWEPVAGQQDADGGVLCVRPADLGVEMFTINDGEIRTSDLMIADGEPRAIEAEGCEGWEEVSFSDDGRRAFTRSAYACEGIEQAGTGMLALVSPTQWVDVRALEVDGERTSWVQRYRLVGVDRAVSEGVEDPGFGMETAARAARFVAHRGVGFVEVEEAARQVDAEAVEGWLANRSEGFAPTADDLEGLADAGVPESVIDVVVAKSFPGTFRIDGEGAAERTERGEESYAASGPRRSLYFGPRMPFAFRMGYGYGYVPADALYYRSGYGYGYPGYSGYWGYRPGTVIIERRAPEPRGRIVRGRGYVRGGSGADQPTAVPRSGGTSGDRPAAAPPRRPSSDRDDPPPRTARPRTPPPGG